MGTRFTNCPFTRIQVQEYHALTYFEWAMNKIRTLVINTSTKRNKHHALTKLLVNVTLLGPKP